MKKIMVSVAPVSAADTQIIPEKIAEDVAECRRLGASMVHLHVRDASGRLTPDLGLLEKTVRLIKEKCDIVIEISTGGVSDLTIEERCTPCVPDYVEANSLNVGSVNLGKAVYCNPADDVEYCVRQILQNNKRPEIEVFELGMIHTVKELDERFHFVKPILFALVFGHGGEMPATPEALRHMVEYLYENFTPEQALWGYTQAHRRDWSMMKLALQKGASSIRIGFEDSVYADAQTPAETNAQIVKAGVELVRSLGMEPMTPDEVRSMLKMEHRK